MLSQSTTPKTSLSRVTLSSSLSTSRPHSTRAAPCQAGRRRYYRNGNFSEDVNTVMDVVADVLAGAESVYAASKRTRDETPFNPEDPNWANRRQSYADTTATSQGEANSAKDGQEPKDTAEEILRAIPVDVEEHPEEYVLYMDVPGLQKSDVKVQVFPAQRKITISGERTRSTKQETDPAGRPYRRRYERRMGKFSRTLQLAKDLDVKTVTARVDHGVLVVTAKKVAPLEPEAMEINID